MRKAPAIALTKSAGLGKVTLRLKPPSLSEPKVATHASLRFPPRTARFSIAVLTGFKKIWLCVGGCVQVEILLARDTKSDGGSSCPLFQLVHEEATCR